MHSCRAQVQRQQRARMAAIDRAAALLGDAMPEDHAAAAAAAAGSGSGASTAAAVAEAPTDAEPAGVHHSHAMTPAEWRAGLYRLLRNTHVEPSR